MTISDSSQEILEKYWIENKEKNRKWKMEVISDESVAAELIKTDYAKSDGQYLMLTENGWNEAQNCIRRHRLAERLLADVLDIKKENLHEQGCVFEHALQKNVEENICTLLGHPNTCPHGKPIPEGNCCRNGKSRLRKLVLPLSDCNVNEKVKIVYIKAHNGQIMNKLMAMGILPGLTVMLLRKSPSYLFQMGESQFAVDKVLAEKIQVRLSE